MADPDKLSGTPAISDGSPPIFGFERSVRLLQDYYDKKAESPIKYAGHINVLAKSEYFDTEQLPFLCSMNSTYAAAELTRR